MDLEFSISVLLRLFMSAVFSSLIGYERGLKRRPAGLRTFVLVCIGSTLAMITNEYIFLKYQSADISRIAAGVVSGVGFLGAGTIIVTGKQQVRGLTTAAGLWATASLGIAIGSGLYLGSVFGFLLIFFTNTVMHKLDEVVTTTSNVIRLYIEISNKTAAYDIFNYLSNSDIIISKYKLENKNKGTYALTLELSIRKKSHEKIKADLALINDVISLEELS